METLKKSWRQSPEVVRKALVLVVGTLFLIGGIIMLAIPGPGLAAIFLAFAIFASEFKAADKLKLKLLYHIRQASKAARERFRSK